MITIKEGSNDILFGAKYFKCHSCGWIGKAYKDEYKTGQQKNDVYYYLTCPFCSGTAYFVEDKKEIENIQLLEKNKIKEK